MHKIIDLTKGVKWDDMRAPASSINPVGQISAPTVDNEDGSLLFSKGNAIAIWFQLPHTYRQGTELRPHLHWSKTTTAIGLPNWQIKYKWANAGDTFSTFSSLLSGIEGVADSNIINKHAIFKFDPLIGTNKLISSMLGIYLQRTNDANDTYSGVAKLLEFDIHYQVDSDGSTQEYIK